MIRNLQETGSSLLNQKVYIDVAKNPDGSMKIDKIDDLTFTIYTGKNGDPNTPVPWANFAAYLSVNWGMMASPTWLDAVKADPTKATIQPSAPVRSSCRATRRATPWW